MHAYRFEHDYQIVQSQLYALLRYLDHAAEKTSDYLSETSKLKSTIVFAKREKLYKRINFRGYKLWLVKPYKNKEGSGINT